MELMECSTADLAKFLSSWLETLVSGGAEDSGPGSSSGFEISILNNFPSLLLQTATYFRGFNPEIFIHRKTAPGPKADQSWACLLYTSPSPRDRG
eukprot:1349906-Rhodomonas_salina.2